jgi:hypothetical protein
MTVHAECTQGDLQGGWVAMVGFDGTGAWSRCDLRIGSCLLPNGTVVNAEPSQFQVNGDSDPKVNRDVHQRWEFIEGVLDTLDRLRDEGRPIHPHHTAAPGSPR